MEQNYSVMNVGTFDKDVVEKGRVMAGEPLGLTGCEVSINHTAPGQFTPFVHSHKRNEEVYLIVKGSGMFKVDAEEFAIAEGSVIRVAPAGERAIKAGEDGLTYLCIQAEAGSLKQATSEDGMLSEGKASWM